MKKLTLCALLALCSVGAQAQVRSLTCVNKVTPDNRIVSHHLSVSEAADGSVTINDAGNKLIIDRWAVNNGGEWGADGQTEDGTLFIINALVHITTSGKDVYDVHYTLGYNHAVTAVDCKARGVWHHGSN